ncbi:MAG: hypothetical protein WDN06_14155 [Asticcacaulis sp.]
MEAEHEHEQIRSAGKLARTNGRRRHTDGLFGDRACLGFELPPSSRTQRAWWSNNASNNVMTRPGSTPALKPPMSTWREKN